jgi:acetate kinase
MATNESILVINTGSSSLKCGIYVSEGGDEALQLDALVDAVGRSTSTLTVKDARGRTVQSATLGPGSQAEALDHVAPWLQQYTEAPLRAIGHRVVHGGPHLVRHQRITPAVREELERSIHFAPLHLPMAIALMDRAGRWFPGVPQYACFDTAFHQTIPEVAARFALPKQLYTDGVRRYGFHGLSYESIVHQLGHEIPARVAMAHLGSGASLAAVKDGRSVDTTMGLTPTGGIPMATRSGDLDPGVLLYLLRAKHMTADALEALLNHESGLTGLSGHTGDMRELETAASAGDADAQLAIDVFCLSIRKVVGAYSAVLEGLDLLVLTGGIGENSVRVQQAVSRGLPSSVTVRVLPSREDRQIARHCRRLMDEPQSL